MLAAVTNTGTSAQLLGVGSGTATVVSDRVARFEALFGGNCDYVAGALRRLGVAEKDLEDVAHDVFVAVFKKLDEYDTERPARPWLFGFAFRQASGYRRLARNKNELVGLDGSPDATTAGDQSRMEARDLLLLALNEVPMERRAVFVMHEIEGHEMTEVAEILKVPVNTAYSRLRKSRTELKEAVERLQQMGETR